MTQGLITLGLMILFLVLCMWVYRPSAKEKYQRAAHIPLNHVDAANKELKQ